MDDTTPFGDSTEPTAAYETLSEPGTEPTPPSAGGPDSASGRHPVSIGHLVMGVAFASILAIWGLYVTDNADLGDLRWLTPLPWLLAGVAGLVALLLAPRRRARRADGVSRG